MKKILTLLAGAALASFGAAQVIGIT